MWGLIVLSIVFLVVEGLLPNASPAARYVRYVDRTLLAIFAVEVTLRVASYRPPSLLVFQRPPMGRLRTHLLARLSYMLHPVILIDIPAPDYVVERGAQLIYLAKEPLLESPR